MDLDADGLSLETPAGVVSSTSGEKYLHQPFSLPLPIALVTCANNHYVFKEILKSTIMTTPNWE
jgi:hypothetical protein